VTLAYSLATARRWCTESESALVALSLAGNEVAWTSAKLKLKIERTRRLRDRNQDLARQLKRANRASTGAKTGREVTSIAVAEKKAKIFDQTLARFVARLERLNAARRVADLKAAVKAALARKQASRAKGPKGPKAPAAVAAAPRARKAPGGAPAAVQLKRKMQAARVRARNARNQARRDSRSR
jgi:hypothetical protein